jgi:hypothetical protein
VDHAARVITAKLAALAAAVVLPATLAACSAEVSAGGYDPDDVADRIQEAQEEATPDLDVSDATCPDDEPEEGATIECTVAIDGVEAPYTVTFTSVDDDGAKFDIAPARAIVSTEKTVDAIAGEFEKQGFPGVEVDCGEKAVIVDDPGSVFTCDVSQEGSPPVKATVTIEDLDGNISFEA